MEQKFHLRRLIVVLSSVLLVMAQTGAFTYTWFYSYVKLGALDRPFYQMGNYAVIALHAVCSLPHIAQTGSPLGWLDEHHQGGSRFCGEESKQREGQCQCKSKAEHTHSGAKE